MGICVHQKGQQLLLLMSGQCLEVADKNGVVLVVEGRIVIADDIVPRPLVKHLAVDGDIRISLHGALQIEFGGQLVFSGATLTQNHHRKRGLVDHADFLFHQPCAGGQGIKAAGIHDGDFCTGGKADTVLASANRKRILLQAEDIAGFLQERGFLCRDGIEPIFNHVKGFGRHGVRGLSQLF